MIAPILLAFRLLLTLSLYAFLGWALLILWRGIKDQGSLLSSRKIPPIRVTILRDDVSPQQLFYSQPEITIGRDPVCECSFEDETVSARHARLSFHQAQWWLEDLDSKNGTLLNGETVKIPTVLTTDDEIRCGNVTLSISIPSGSPETSSSDVTKMDGLEDSNV